MQLKEVVEKAAFVLCQLNRGEHWFHERFGNPLEEMKAPVMDMSELKELMIQEKFIEWNRTEGYWWWAPNGYQSLCWGLLEKMVEDEGSLLLEREGDSGFTAPAAQEDE
jgi:hypothetical protein